MQPKHKKIIFKSGFLLNLVNYYNFYRAHGRFPKNPPVSFNDYFFRIKKNLAHEPLRIFVSDKEYVKLYVKALIGDAYNVPTYAILHTKAQAEAFLSQKSGRKFVVKPTHMSGKCLFGNDVLPQKDIAEACSWFDIDYFAITGESNYRNLQPKLIVEEFIDFDGDRAPKDYKLFCVNGTVLMIQVTEDRFGHHQRAIYSPYWQKLPYKIKKMKEGEFEKPANLSEMLRVAEQLSAAFDIIRVDLFSDNTTIRIGELTNVHSNAAEVFEHYEDDLTIGKGITDILLVNK